MTIHDKIVSAGREHFWLAIILAAFLALAVTYAIVTPIFEAGDELWHYPYVQHLATGHALPVQDPAIKTLWAQEGGQPPLYYALVALITSWIDTHDLPERLWTNPHAAIGIPLLFGNKNMIIHTSAENFPWHNTTLAVHLIRFVSIIFSVATIAITYFIGLELVPKDKAFGAIAAAFVAFNPMFIFISASVNNDSLAAMLATLALWLLIRLFTKGASTRRFIYLGIALGLAAITKTSDLGLVVVAACVFILLFWREGFRFENFSVLVTRYRALFIGMLISAALVVAIAFWWYVRNWTLYGDPFAFNVWVAIAGGRPAPATLATLLGEFQGMRISFWGNFGGVNIIAADWVYRALDALTIVASIGLFLGLVHRALPRLILLPVFWLALIFAALVRWTLLTLASQGRLLFPAISAIGILLAFGLSQFQISRLPPVFRRSPLIVPMLFLFGFAALAPFQLIAPTYALPKRLAAGSNIPNPIHIVFDNQAELVGYDLPQKSGSPNSELPITIYWQAREQMTEDFSVYIHLFDPAGKPIGQWDAYPGNGLYPTRLWQMNEILVDNYRVPVAADARGPSVGRIEVGLYRRATLINLTARDPQGRAITPTITRFKIPGRLDVRVENPLNANFGDQLALVGYGSDQRAVPGSSLAVRLYWRALKAMDEDYTIFVHLVDANGKLLAQKDDQPQRGVYPTSFWDAGEIVADAYAVEIPRDAAPGDYRIWVGIYHARDGSRLTVNGRDYLDVGIVQIAR